MIKSKRIDKNTFESIVKLLDLHYDSRELFGVMTWSIGDSTLEIFDKKRMFFNVRIAGASFTRSRASFSVFFDRLRDKDKKVFLYNMDLFRG